MQHLGYHLLPSLQLCVSTCNCCNCPLLNSSRNFQSQFNLNSLQESIPLGERNLLPCSTVIPFCWNYERHQRLNSLKLVAVVKLVLLCFSFTLFSMVDLIYIVGRFCNSFSFWDSSSVLWFSICTLFL